MMRMISLTAATFVLMSAAAMADPIEGNWRTESGETAAIAPCGGAYCITLKSGKYNGKRIGKMSGSSGDYSGTITDPADDKTYSGSGSLNGNVLKMRGCVLAVLCKTQTWNRL